MQPWHASRRVAALASVLCVRANTTPPAQQDSTERELHAGALSRTRHRRRRGSPSGTKGQADILVN